MVYEHHLSIKFDMNNDRERIDNDIGTPGCLQAFL